MRVALALALMSSLAVATFAACADNEPPASTPDSGVIEGGDAGTIDPDGGSNGSDASAGADSGVVIVDGGVEDNCHPLDQTGCTPPATKCVIEPDGQNAGAHCTPPGNDVGLGEQCMGEDCLAGLACVMTSTVASCVQICNIGSGAGCEALGADYDCRTRIIGTNWGACSLLPPICDHLTQAPCEVDQACSTFTRRNNVRELRCREAGPQTEGMPCGSSANGAACIRGNVCVNNRNTMTATCVKFCDSNDDCAAPLTCSGVVSDPPFQFCSE